MTPASTNNSCKSWPEVYEIGSTLGGDNAFLKHAMLDGRLAAVKM